MSELAAIIKKRFETLVDQFDRHLQEHPGYAAMPADVRRAAAGLTLNFVADWVARGDDSQLIEFIRDRARERAGQGLNMDMLQHAVNGLEVVLEPHVRNVEMAKFVWRSLSKAHDAITQVATEATRTSEKRLRESDERWRLLFDQASDAIFIENENDDILDVNDRACQLLGYSREELLRMKVPDLQAPEVRKQAGSVIKGEVPLGGQVFEGLDLHRDGARIPVEISTTRIVGREEGLVLSIVRDIRERKHLEREIRESLERRGRQVQTSTEIAQEIAAAPALDELFDRVVTLIKERFGYYHAQIFRYAAEQDAVVLVTGYGQVGHKMLAAGHKLAMGRGVVGTAAAASRPILATDVTKDKDWQPNPNLPDTQGELAVPIKLRDEVLGILDVQSTQAGALTAEDQLLLEGLCGQIAIAIENKRTEQALAQEQYLMNILMDNSPDHIYFKDAQSRFIRVSKSQSDWFGLGDPAQAIGKADFDFFTQEHARPAYEDELTIMRTGQPITLEEKETWPDQPDSWVLTTKMPLRDKAGNIVGTFGISRDITERKQAEAKMQETMRELERLYRATAREGWQAFLETAERPAGYLFDRATVQPQAEVWTPQIEQAVRQNTLVPPAGEQPVAAAPLSIRGEIIGAVGIYDDPQNPLSSEDLELVQQIAEQGALALESARLFEQTQAALDEARVLYEAGRRVSSATTPQEMLAAVVEGVRVPAISRALLWDLEYSITNEPEAFIVTGNWRRDDDIQPLPVGARFALKQFPAANLVMANDPVFVEDVTCDERVDPMSCAVFQQQQTRGVALLPLWVGNRQLGLVMLVSEQPHRFAEKETRPFTSLARQVAIALENRRLFDQTRIALEEVEATQRRYLGQQWETYFRSAGDKPTSFVDSPLGLTAADSPWLPEMEQALEVGEPIFIVGPEGQAQRSGLAVPLKLRGMPIGVIEFYEEGTRREWSNDEQAMVQALADQAVLALENARLFEDTQARAQREQLINEITARVRASTDMQTILRTTSAELTRVLDLPWARIRLGIDEGNGQAE